MSIARYIDHTYLKADGTAEKIKELCTEAKQYGFAAVCVNPCWVALAKRELAGTNTQVATVVGFPLGATSTEAKVAETRQAVADGADEIDMVMQIGWFKSGYVDKVWEDIAAVVAAAGSATVKVIIETALLTDDEKVLACQLAAQAGAHYVKTSTGFGPAGATVDDVKLMRNTVGASMGVKAAGGIRTLRDARAMLEAGATRIGVSAGVSIVQEEQAGE